MLFTQKLFLWLVLLSTCTLAKAQQENSLWLFGSSGGIQFSSSGVPSVIPSPTRTGYGGAPPLAEGCGMANNPKTGAMFFCTDGVTVYQANGQVMAGGSNIGGISGNSCMQAVAIAPVDCNYRKFYVFINTANSDGATPKAGTISYRIVDMDANGGQGMVLPTSNNILYTESDESMVVYFNPSTSQYFLIYKKVSGNDFYVAKLTQNPADIATNTAKYTLAFPAGLSAVDAHAIKVSGTLGKIAFGARNPAQYVFTLDFDVNTGAISNWQTIDDKNLNSLGNAQSSIVYDCEWSPDGTKLYTCQLGGTVVYQYDYSQQPMLRTTIYTDPTAGLTAQTGGLKTGPDGKIYFRYNIAMQKVHSIDNPNAAGALCNFKLNVLTLDAGAINAYQFPVTCEYEDTLSSIAAVGATTFCNGDSVRLEAKGGKRYVWSNGQIGSFISVKNTGTYYVFTTFPSGCVHASNTIKINVNIPAKADAGADKTVACGSTTDLMAIAPANGSYSYQWLGGPAAQNYPNVGAGTYVLVMTDNASSCQSFDTVIVENTRQSFSISGLPTDTFVCKNNTISLTANIQGSGTYTHSWIDDKGNTYPDTANLTAVITQNTVFTYRVSDGICSDSRNINVSLADAKGTLTVNSSTTLCKGDSVQLIAPAGGTYLWNNGETTREILVGQQGNYYCTRTVGTCQANTDTISITDASFSATLMVSNNRVKENESITFTGSNSSYIYDWDFGDTTKATGFSVNHTYSTEGTYIATATVSNGTCSMQIQNVITVGNPAGNTTELNLYLPTGFITSGGTDYYQALPIGASEFNMFIFNRWGMAVFYTNTVLYQWDGKDLKGNECPDGIYAVLAQVKNTQGATVNKTGTVYLLRK